MARAAVDTTCQDIPFPSFRRVHVIAPRLDSDTTNPIFADNPIPKTERRKNVKDDVTQPERQI